MVDCQDRTEITQLLKRVGTGDEQARERLYEVVYDELRQLARVQLRSRNQGDLESAALVNEVVLRFEQAQSLQGFANRRALFSVAIRAMNQVLINHYRRRKKDVDGGTRVREPLDAIVRAMEAQSGCDLDDLQRALKKLEAETPRQHSVIMHRFFGGLTIAETAKLLEISDASVERDWRLARAKLYRDLKSKSL